MTKNTEYGWMWYVGMAKQLLGRDLEEHEYKSLMQQYIKGIKVEVAVK